MMNSGSTDDSPNFGHFLFYCLNFVSMLLSVLVYKIFKIMKQNFLIRSSSVICFIISFVLFLGWPLSAPHKSSEIFCNVQALVLNYCFVSTHAHFSFVMWNNLITAMGWKFFGIKDTSALIGLMFFVSISIPMVPTIIILASTLDPYTVSPDDYTPLPASAQIFSQNHFFCVVNEPAWLGYRFWFLLFSVPGIVAACILFWKSIQSRRHMMKLKTTSQFSKSQLLRMFFAILAYLTLSVLSVVLGFMSPRDPKIIHFSEFLPAGVGLLMFATYGVGATAMAFYKRVYLKMGAYLGIEMDEDQSLNGSRKDSASTTISRKKSSIRSSSEFKSRRISQLSTSLDENFIYDLQPASAPPGDRDDSERKSVTKHVLRKNSRRGSEPINRRNSSLIDKCSSISSIEEMEEEHESEK